ncbi:MAG TPA: hypothetical protein VJ719_08365 [Chthoniobacterales bacterium]|nr:hypothetical protein [Chthoniobacterales bacterium]
MNVNETQTSQPVGNDPEELSRLLEIELMQKKAQWQQKTARNKNLKSFSIMFLFLVVMAGLAAFYFVFMQANEGRQQRTDAVAQP